MAKMSPLRRFYGKNKGFTLLEILITVAIGSVLLTVLYATFFTVFRAGRAAESTLDGHIKAGRLIDRFTEDIHAAYFRLQGKETFFTGEQKGLSPVVSLTAFTYPVLKKGFPTTDLSAMRYFMEEGEGGYTIFRESWNPYIGDKVKVEMLGKVDKFEVSYFNGSSWVKAWDSGLEKALPAAVKVSITLKSGEEFTALSRTMIKAAN